MVGHHGRAFHPPRTASRRPSGIDPPFSSTRDRTLRRRPVPTAHGHPGTTLDRARSSHSPIRGSLRKATPESLRAAREDTTSLGCNRRRQCLQRCLWKGCKNETVESSDISGARERIKMSDFDGLTVKFSFYDECNRMDRHDGRLGHHGQRICQRFFFAMCTLTCTTRQK